MNIVKMILCVLMEWLFPILPDPERLLNWTLGTSVLILAVILLRWALNGRISCRLCYALWAVVLVRALIPFQLPVAAPVSTASLTPDTPRSWDEVSIPMYNTGSEDFETAHEYYHSYVTPGYLGAGPWSSGYVERSEDGETLTHYLEMYSPAQVIQCVYLAGLAVTAGALFVSNHRFKKKLRRTRKELEVENCPIPVYVAEGLPSPCLVDLIWPAIYLTPEAAEDGTLRRHVLTHELTHYAHRDHIWAVLRCVCLSLHWFNPLVWGTVRLSKRDCELACDEGAVARLGEEERFAYGRTLVDMVAQNGKTNLLSCSTTMTEGKKSIQQRIELLVKHPETKKTALFLAVSLAALAAVFTFAGEKAETPESGLSTSEYDTFLTLLDKLFMVKNYASPLSSGIPYTTIREYEDIESAKALLREQTAPLEEGADTTRAAFPNGGFVMLDIDALAATAYEYDVWPNQNGDYFLYRIDEDDPIPVASVTDAGVGGLALLGKETDPNSRISLGMAVLNADDTYTVDDPEKVARLSELLLGDEETVRRNESPDYDMADWLANHTARYIVRYGTPYWVGDTAERWYARAMAADEISFYGLELPEHMVGPVLALCTSPFEEAAATPVSLPAPELAVRQFGENLAEAYRTIPSLHPRAVTDAVFVSAEIYEQIEDCFCANITLALQPVEPNTIDWMAGAGIDPMEGEYAGYWELTREYKFVKGADHFWHCVETATGGLRAD